jgi:hypothetical protein
MCVRGGASDRLPSPCSGLAAIVAAGGLRGVCPARACQTRHPTRKSNNAEEDR